VRSKLTVPILISTIVHVLTNCGGDPVRRPIAISQGPIETHSRTNSIHAPARGVGFPQGCLLLGDVPEVLCGD